MAATAAQASSAEEKGTSINAWCRGRGSSFKVALVTMPRVPSLPTINWVKLYPVEFLRVLAPVSMTRPSANTTSRFNTQSLVTPYFTARGPPLFSAMFPPMVQVPLDAGSTAYINPWASAAFDSSSVMTPGPTMAWWLRVSMDQMRFIRRMDMAIPPFTGRAPPLRPVLAPAAVTGKACRLAQARSLDTSSVLSGSTTTSGGNDKSSVSSEP